MIFVSEIRMDFELYLYMYIYVCVCVYIYIYVFGYFLTTTVSSNLYISTFI